MAVSQNLTKAFKVSYQGEAEYEIADKRYRVRTFALEDGGWRADYWPTILAEVGTVRASHWPEAGEFPSADVMALFPGYVAARYDQDNGYQVVCNGSVPTVALNHLGWYEVQL